MKKFSKHLDWVIILTAIMWLVQIINVALGYQLNRYGILPRQVSGLTGIFVSPFLHGSFSHLILNTVPFFVLSAFVVLNGLARYFAVTFWIAVIGGLGVWCLARDAYHVGASGLIFGYFGYLLSYGIFNRQLKDIVVALVVFALYGGMVWGVFPMKQWISWEAHLSSLVVGVVLGKWYARA